MGAFGQWAEALVKSRTRNCNWWRRSGWSGRVRCAERDRVTDCFNTGLMHNFAHTCTQTGWCHYQLREGGSDARAWEKLAFLIHKMVNFPGRKAVNKRNHVLIHLGAYETFLLGSKVVLFFLYKFMSWTAKAQLQSLLSSFTIYV